MKHLMETLHLIKCLIWVYIVSQNTLRAWESEGGYQARTLDVDDKDLKALTKQLKGGNENIKNLEFIVRI